MNAVPHFVSSNKPIPIESLRMDIVRRYAILDTPPDGAFDRVAAIAARLLDTPMLELAELLAEVLQKAVPPLSEQQVEEAGIYDVQEPAGRVVRVAEPDGGIKPELKRP